MHDHVSRIQENPVAIGQAFDFAFAESGIFQIPHQMIGKGAHMALGSTRGNDHGIGKRGFAFQVNGDDVLGLVVVEGLEDEFENLGRFGSTGGGVAQGLAPFPASRGISGEVF